MEAISSLVNQSVFIPTPTLTEKNLPSQAGKVCLVTGGYAGVGEQLSQILYAAGATVYIAGRSQEKADTALQRIRKAVPDSKGGLHFLKLDLADLGSIKPAVEHFLAREKRLDNLTQNAGVMVPPAGSVDNHGHELQIGTNCLGPHLLAQLLRPILASTAKQAPPGAVRVSWAGSLAVDVMSPKPGGMTFEESENGKPKVLGRQPDYGQSKTGNLFLSCESKRRWGDADGVCHVCFNPGNLNTELSRHTTGAFMLKAITYPAIMGAYTELFSGFSPELGMADSGAFIKPWGRVGGYRRDIGLSLASEADGGSGKAAAFWDWCEKETASFK